MLKQLLLPLLPLKLALESLTKWMVFPPADYTFKRKDQAITMASKNAVKVDGENIEIDPQLLFQRFSTAAGSDFEASLAYELCTYPPALFESPNLPLEPQKGTLADAIWNFAKPDQCSSKGTNCA